MGELNLFRARQMTPVFFAAWGRFADDDFVRLLKLAGVIAFRYSVRKAHGRIEQRSIAVLTPPRRLINYPHVARIFRITRRRTDARRHATGAATTEHVCGFTSVPAHRAAPQQLPAWNRGHWAVEVNHHIRDATFAEDACPARTRFAPVNNATCTNIALAIILHRTRFDSIAATRHFAFRHQDAFDALLQP